ncbi:hypothetical protein, partial [Rhodoferax sp.]|uniref:hypothetical protein n=1 Tax=Rhodoferax sp. TaxID=50421 RepID=UPI00262E4C19
GMKIAQSAVALQSWHASASVQTQSIQARAWVGSQRPDFEGRNTTTRRADAGVQLTLSGAARASVRADAAQRTRPCETTTSDAACDVEPRLRVLMDMVQAITGRAVKVFHASELRGQPTPATPAAPQPAQAQADATATAVQGWGVEVDSHSTLQESETTQVQAQGTVLTADGQRISFALTLTMARSFEQTTDVAVRLGDAVRKDPLVINFDGQGVTLTDTQFAFDLEGDGQNESIAMVGGGSGFLVLDRNHDGQVNDGTELFGPRSGDGFADLAQYDQDGNQWIDANDAIYSQLGVWQRDTDGQDRYSSLADHKVGALYLGRVDSPFSVNTAANQTLGQVRSTGLFLYESGQSGTVQQVDL